MDQAARLGELRELLQVGERQRRVGGRLGEDQLRVRLDRRLHRLQVGEVDKVELHAHVGEHRAARAVGAAVRAVGDHAVVARLHRRAHDGDRRRHPRAEARRAVPALELRNFVLERHHRRVARPRVRVAAVEVLLDRLLDVRRRLHDRREDRAVDRIRGDARVHELRVVLGLLRHPRAALECPHGAESPTRPTSRPQALHEGHFATTSSLEVHSV